MVRRDGTTRDVEAVVCNQTDRPSVAGYVSNIRDITERKKFEALLAHRALHDPLTGLANRQLILDRADQMLVRARRTGAPVAALFIDLDNFKDSNDSLGHGAGDQLLQMVAGRLHRHPAGERHGRTPRWGRVRDPGGRCVPGRRTREDRRACPPGAEASLPHSGDRGHVHLHLGQHRHRRRGIARLGRSCCGTPTSPSTGPRGRAGTSRSCSSGPCSRRHGSASPSSPTWKPRSNGASSSCSTTRSSISTGYRSKAWRHSFDGSTPRRGRSRPTSSSRCSRRVASSSKSAAGCSTRRAGRPARGTSKGTGPVSRSMSPCGTWSPTSSLTMCARRSASATSIRAC